MEQGLDDGSLSFLNIEYDNENKYFNCEEVKLQDLINLEFWVIDFISNVKTKHGDDRCVVKLNLDINNMGNNHKKFITSSKDIKYVLNKIKEKDAFPRKVRLKKQGQRYFFE